MIISSEKDLIKLKAGGKILSAVLQTVSGSARIGVSTCELDELASKTIKQLGARPSFLDYQGYPATLCTSVNEQLVHGLPGNYKLKNGDILGIDCGIWYEGFCTDMALTIGIGNISQEDKKLINITKESLQVGLNQVKAGKKVGDYGAAVQNYVEKNGFAVIRGLVGHGVGLEVHEEPRIPNFGRANEGKLFTKGMVLALEPMVALGSYQVETLSDGWTIVMTDGSNSAHFELTVMVTNNGYELITPLIW